MRATPMSAHLLGLAKTNFSFPQTEVWLVGLFQSGRLLGT